MPARIHLDLEEKTNLFPFEHNDIVMICLISRYNHNPHDIIYNTRLIASSLFLTRMHHNYNNGSSIIL